MVTPNQQQLISLQRWRLSTCLVMIVGYIGYYLCRGNLSAALPLLSKTFHYSNTELAIILTFSELFYALGKFINGPLADQIGGKRIFLLGMLGAIVFNLAFTQASSLLMFTLLWSVCRFFLSMGWGGIVKIVGAWYEPERNGTVMGLISINFQLGGGAAFLLCSLLLYLGYDWQGLFIIPALILTVIMIWSFFASKESPQEVVPGVNFGKSKEGRTNLAGFESREGKKLTAKEILATLFKNQIFRNLLWFSFLTTFLRSAFGFWTTKFLSDLGLSDVSAIINSSVFPLVGILGSLLLGWYTDKYAKNGNRAGAMWVMLVGLVFSLFLIAFLIPYRLEFKGWIVFLTGACGFFLIGPYSMISGCLTLDIAGSEGGGTCTGMFDGVGYLGGTLAAWGTGVLSDKLGWSQVFYILSAFSILVVMSAYRISQLYRKQNEPEDLVQEFAMHGAV